MNLTLARFSACPGIYAAAGKALVTVSILTCSIFVLQVLDRSFTLCQNGWAPPWVSQPSPGRTDAFSFFRFEGRGAIASRRPSLPTVFAIFSNATSSKLRT